MRTRGLRAPGELFTCIGPSDQAHCSGHATQGEAVPHTGPRPASAARVLDSSFRATQPGCPANCAGHLVINRAVSRGRALSHSHGTRMTTYHDRVLVALALFNGRLSAFSELVSSKPADPPRLPKKALDDLLAIAARARAASDAITRSFTLIEQTSLDIVDMQVRLQGETARLASSLRELGERVERQPLVRDAFSDPLVALDEASQLVAAAVFPSSVQGLRAVNVKLWDFEKLQWKRYTDILSAVVQSRRISSDQQVTIQSIADDVARAFADVNTLLNELAESREADGASLRKRLEAAPAKLTSALQKADSRMTPAFSMFAPVVKASKKVA